MAFVYPFNFVAKTAAKASEVMANLNYIKAILDGGITLANMADGTAPKILDWNGGAVVAPANGAQLLTGGEQEFELDVKSTVLFGVSCFLEVGAAQSAEAVPGEVAANLNVDGALAVVASLAVVAWPFGGGATNIWVKSRASVSEEITEVLPAGSHKLSVTFGRAGHEINYGVGRTRAFALVVPSP